MADELSVTALAIEDAVSVLRKSGAKNATAEIVARHIEGGCPVNEDGTLNLIVYCAWLTQQGQA